MINNSYAHRELSRQVCPVDRILDRSALLVSCPVRLVHLIICILFHPNSCPIRDNRLTLFDLKYEPNSMVAPVQATLRARLWATCPEFTPSVIWMRIQLRAICASPSSQSHPNLPNSRGQQVQSEVAAAATAHRDLRLAVNITIENDQCPRECTVY